MSSNELEELRDRITVLTKERDEADRRAGAAEREMEHLRNDAAARSSWITRAKRDAGFDNNVSFDVVWAEVLLYAKLSGFNPNHGLHTHLKSGTSYRKLCGVTNATNAQSGQKMALYARGFEVYVREINEFNEKFEEQK